MQAQFVIDSSYAARAASFQFISSRGKLFANLKSQIDDQGNKRTALVVDDVMDVTEMLSVLSWNLQESRNISQSTNGQTHG